MSFKFPEKYRVPASIIGLNAFRIARRGMIIHCVGSVDGGLWEHVSVTISYPGEKPKRCPTWDEMCFVKNLFWDEEDQAVQVHPRKSQYANLHDFCLHLWRPVGGFPDHFPG